MLGSTYERENCSAARALEIIGERWSLLIARNAIFGGATRFSEFESLLGIAPNVLAKRLATFVDAGLFELRPVGAPAGQREYVLTEKGRDLTGVVVALTEWGDRWEAPNGPPVLFSHDVCDGAVHARVSCVHCGPVTDPSSVQRRPGPGSGPRS